MYKYSIVVVMLVFCFSCGSKKDPETSVKNEVQQKENQEEANKNFALNKIKTDQGSQFVFKNFANKLNLREVFYSKN